MRSSSPTGASPWPGSCHLSPFPPSPSRVVAISGGRCRSFARRFRVDLVEDEQPRARRARPARAPRWSEVPGPVYLDASALATLYFPEAGSDALDKALRGRRDLTVSDLAVTELLAVFAGRRLAQGEAGAAAAARRPPGRPRLRDLPPSGDHARDAPSGRAAARLGHSAASGRRRLAPCARDDRGRRLVPHPRPAPRRGRTRSRAQRISMRPTAR